MSQASTSPSDSLPPPAGPVSALAIAERRGRRVAFAAYLSVAAAVAVASGGQVFLQAFERREAKDLQIKSCDDGLSHLTAALERARTAASATDGEDAALLDFRRALNPDWDDRDHIEDLCRSSPSKMAALDAIEQLRYAEEHAIRREAAELAPLRRRVQAQGPRAPEPSAAATTSASPPSPLINHGALDPQRGPPPPTPSQGTGSQSRNP